jgi:hypothetical protein
MFGGHSVSRTQHQQIMSTRESLLSAQEVADFQVIFLYARLANTDRNYAEPILKMTIVPYC